MCKISLSGFEVVKDPMQGLDFLKLILENGETMSRMCDSGMLDCINNDTYHYYQ